MGGMDILVVVIERDEDSATAASSSSSSQPRSMQLFCNPSEAILNKFDLLDVEVIDFAEPGLVQVMHAVIDCPFAFPEPRHKCHLRLKVMDNSDLKGEDARRWFQWFIKDLVLALDTSLNKKLRTSHAIAKEYKKSGDSIDEKEIDVSVTFPPV